MASVILCPIDPNVSNYKKVELHLADNSLTARISSVGSNNPFNSVQLLGDANIFVDNKRASSYPNMQNKKHLLDSICRASRVSVFLNLNSVHIGLSR